MVYKIIKRCLCIALSAVIVLTVLVTPSDAVEPCFSDIEGHWAQAKIEAATYDGWINGYPNGTFQPESDVTRAEFVKMLLAATHLTPDSATAKFLHEVSNARAGGNLTDMENHWLTCSGWTQVALDFGLVISSDYANGSFAPNQLATRQEAAVMIVRALGLVYPAQQNENAELPFIDAQELPKWLRGYVAEAVRAGVLNGYPDKRFRGNEAVTRAEAVAMIFRAMNYMEEGAASDIRVYAEKAGYQAGDAQRTELMLSAPAQVIDGTVYLPMRDVLKADAALYDTTVLWSSWYAKSQQLIATYVSEYCSGAGDVRYSENGPVLGPFSKVFPVPARLLYGELMIPIYTQGNIKQPGFWYDVQWNAEERTLVIALSERQQPLS